MKKILVEVYLPACLKSYDVEIPTEVRFSQVTSLIAAALSQITRGEYAADKNSLLCDRDSGSIFNIDMTPWELGLRTGSRLMLI